MILSLPFRSSGAAISKSGALLLAVCLAVPAWGAPLAPPLPPTGVTVQAIADNAIHVEWLHSGDDVVRFVIYRAGDVSGPFERITSTPRPRRSYTDVDLKPDTEYCYLVEAENSDGVASSAPACARTLSARPSAPTNVSVSQVEGSPYLDVSWQHSDFASVSFVVYRQWVPGDVLPLPIDTVSAAPYRDRGGRADAQTCYSVSALSPSGESPPSDPLCFTPQFTTAALPSGITAFARSAFRIDVAWSLPVYNYATLLLERSDDGGAFAEVAAFEEKVLGFDDQDLAPDTQYCYRLKAVNAISESPYSPPVCTRTPFTRPDRPNLTGVSSSGVTDLEIVWSAAVLPRHWFEVQRRTQNGPFVTVADSTTSLSFVDTNLVELTEYCYVVRALNPMFESEASNERCASTGLESPTAVGDLTAVPDSQDPTASLVLSWTASSPASFTTYEIDVREPEGEWDPALRTGNIFATISGLKDATLYEVRVTAVRQVDAGTTRSDPAVASGSTFLAHWAGDTNGDGSVSSADVTFLTSPGVYGQPTPLGSDGTDVSWRLRAIEVGDSDPNLLRSDTDRSGGVDLFDFLAIAANLGRSIPGAGVPLAAVVTSDEHAQTIRAVLDAFRPASETQNRLVEELILLLETREAQGIPNRLDLAQNYPNPFNPQTAIRYDIPQKGPVRLSIYNPLGQEVVRLVDAELEAGRYTTTWDASDLPSGLYLGVLRTASEMRTRSMTLLR